MAARLAAVTATLMLTLAGCSEPSPGPVDPQPVAAPESPADLVLRGGKVITMDPAIGNAGALAITGHTITAVGSDAEIDPYIGEKTEVIDLAGRVAIPGLIEGHGHYLSLGRSRQILDLTSVANWSEVVSMVAVAADQAEPGEWIFGRGWHQDKWDSVPLDAVDGVPRNDTLSAVSPDNPVLLGHASGHAAFANDAALALAGIDAGTEDPAGGTIVRSADGEATGLLRETAQRLVDEAVAAYQERLTDEQQEALLRQQVQLAGEVALRHGVTSFHDAGADFETVDFFRQLESEGNLPVRLYVMLRRQSNQEFAAALPRYRMVAEGNDFLTVRSIKRQIDGALGAHGAWLLEPYEDLPDSVGLVLEPVEEIEATAELAVQHGFQVNVHAIGTRANREVLDLFERVWERTGADGESLRWRIEHAQHIHPDDVPRFGQLGVIAAVQGIHCASDGPWIPSRLGDERTGNTSYLWRDLIDSGAVISNGTDVPVERIDAIASFYATVSRMMSNGERFYPEQALTREEALASYTINNAYAAFEEDIKGSLTPGKLADVTVLSQDLLTVPEELIPATTVDMTFVGGELRYARRPQ